MRVLEGQLISRHANCSRAASGNPFCHRSGFDLGAEGETTITVRNAGTDGFVILDALQLLPEKQ